MGKAEAPAVMLDPSLLAPGDSWRWVCNTPLGRDGKGRELICKVVTQGGVAGLEAHRLTVHGPVD